VFQAEEGYGHSGRMHRGHWLSDDRPVSVVMIGEPDRLRSFLAGNAALPADAV
jgi:PII-like signaling protein